MNQDGVALDRQVLRVLIADDHAMILELFSMYLATQGMEVTTTPTFDGAHDLILGKGPYDVVLLDLQMPGMNGISGLRRAIRVNGGKPVAILTGDTNPRMLEEILQAGAAGLVLKTSGLRSLSNAIRFMHSGERFVPLEALRQMRTKAGEPGAEGVLSPKEMTVLRYLASGRPNKEIAGDLRLSEATVKMRVTAICRKLGAQNRTQAVVIARDLGLV